ncbi:hypothetical protein TSAR_015750 [Trichomalopsis sarcophagae]|uniref:Regulator of telomere elongation helicase 1 homolog n=1 Tax=Trichomalopsis sarcophagae TaxID=543379 RepID=A0A232F640_9HYME|nr:hypothetical protein TSAR_015750 [Trichomalopsis sarcophagae]
MTEVTLNGVVIKFPFKPYQVQEDYMKKVIECLQEGKNGVLESPTGTGKTLSLLCSSLGWLMIKKAQIQIQVQSLGALDQVGSGNSYLDQFAKSLDKGGGKSTNQAPTNTFGWSMPKIIYASRTHSQLSQAMQELKRTSYRHVSVTVLGSRDQLCIHPEVAKEQNTSNKIHMCQAKIRARNCFYYNNVELRKDDPTIKDNILDIEDLVKTGQKLKCCPYFLSKELKQNADIIFMPYNYLLDPKTRKNQGIELQNNVVLLDEAHNVEKMCEEAASLQISSTDIAVCIDEITHVMKDMANETNDQDFLSEGSNAAQKDFSAEDLCILKAMFLELEKAIDSIQITKRDEGDTYPGGYIFEILEKADITQGKELLVIDKLDKIVTYLTTVSASSFTRKGNALQKFSDLLRVVFAGSTNNKYREKIKQCYKVYIQAEPAKKSFKNDAWETKKITKTDGKLISYWCFSPGFGMQQLLDQGVRSVILTSGTLSPLKPFISEIGIEIGAQLENPHIVSNKQICVGIISNGYDGCSLNSSYNTRNDPKYIASLGETIKIFSCILPHGMLIFFPSYPIMKKCQEEWQKMGKWSQIEASKPIFVEPQSKEGFNNVMTEYYKKIHDPAHKGAIFMAVCRGKVSEGLDFANANGRAVLITGLPFPPLKDPRVILKQRYLEENRASGKESLSGQQWYQLEASRAVNQAIGRIIRHKNDYGAILLCDCRFDNPSFKQHLSSWIRPHIKKFQDFRMVVKELREFFRYTTAHLPQPAIGASEMSSMALPSVPAEFDTSNTRIVKSNSKTLVTTPEEKQNENFDLNAYKIKGNTEKEKKTDQSPKDFGSLFETKSKTVVNFSTCKLQTTANTFKEVSPSEEPNAKRRKLKIKPVQFSVEMPVVSEPSTSCTEPGIKTESQRPRVDGPEDSAAARQQQGKKYIQQVKGSVSPDDFNTFKILISKYNKGICLDELIAALEKLFLIDYKLKHLYIGFRNFLRKDHIKAFDAQTKLMESLDDYLLDKPVLQSESQEVNVNKPEDTVASRQEQGKKYIQQVRESISPEEYSIFKRLMNSYKNDANFDELVNGLEKLFVIDHKLKHLFIGFRSFLKKDHTKSFDSHIHAMEGSSIW